MCTITFWPNQKEKGGFVLIDNRDEAVNRPAEFPRHYEELETELFYPKDKQAGGTWLGVGRNKQLVALMNGGIKKHERKPFYRKSRGIVVKELLAMRDIEEGIFDYNFLEIEPFFAVVVVWRRKLKVFELIWDGNMPTLNHRDSADAMIWSSIMTYNEEQHTVKEKKLAELWKAHKGDEKFPPEALVTYHHSKRQGEEKGLIIDRGFLKTTSIAQFTHYSGQKDTFFYEDLLSDKHQEEEINWKNEEKDPLKKLGDDLGIDLKYL